MPDTCERKYERLGGRALVSTLRLLPRNALSRWAGELTRRRGPPLLRRAAIRLFAAHYRIDEEACAPLDSFETFEAFFTRALKPGLRPIAPGDEVVVSPVDGVVSERGVAAGGRLLQAKGIEYALEDLLADGALAARFREGPFATLYLSPRDYHRIHFPLPGAVTGYRYVPGTLWPVNPASVRGVPGLFTVNERLVTLLATPLGACAVVAVGATIVGRVRASYDEAAPISNRRGARPRVRDYPAPLPVEKGAELGRFEMGSTVILLLEPGRAKLRDDLVAGRRVLMGEAIGGRAG